MRRATPSFARAFVRGATLALCVAACGAQTFVAAASFDNYRMRVGVALSRATDLFNTLDGEEAGKSVDEVRAEQTLAALRQTLPPQEHVDWSGGALEADNAWLHKELDAYAAVSADKLKERKAIISRVVERLAVLDHELDEAARAATAARDKDAEKGKLQTILRRPEYNEQAARGSALQRLWEWIKELLRKLLPKSSPMSPGAAGALSVVARIFVYALAVAVIAFVVWRYGPRVLNQISTRRKRKHAEGARVVLGERLAPDETSADLIAEAERLARAGDVRGAIRKAYIAVLCELGDRKLIRLAQHKTNRDYLMSVRDRAELYGALRPLTNGFEQHWYGFAPATDADWDQYRSLCQQTLAG